MLLNIASLEELRQRKSAFGDEDQPYERPEKYPAFPDYGYRYADGGSDPQLLGDKMSTGFIHADHKGDELEHDGYSTAHRLKQE